MPTAQPLDEDELGDIFEGPLKSIAGFATTTPTPQVKETAATKTVAAENPVSTVSQSETPKTAGIPKGNIRLTGIRTPGVGLSGFKHKEEESGGTPAVSAKGANGPARNGKYADEDVTAAWERFIKTNTAEHLLVNAMRVTSPKRIENDTFLLTQSAVHLGYISENLRRLTEYIRDAVGNDKIAFKLQEVSEDSPLIWNDRELLGHIIENNPTVGEFVTKLGLKLL